MKLWIPTVLTGVIGTPAAIALLFAQNPQPTTIIDQKVELYNSPTDMTVEQRTAFHEALAKGTPLPPGFAFVETEGDVTAMLTGLVMPNGKKQLVVTLQDEVADLQVARLYINGTLMVIATPDNGSIVTNGDRNVATLSTWVTSYPISAELQWDNQIGTTHSRTFSSN